MTPLRAARIKAGKTIAEVAHLVGVDQGNLSRIERGEQNAGKDLAEKLARYYGNEVTEIQIIYPERYTKQQPKL